MQTNHAPYTGRPASQSAQEVHARQAQHATFRADVGLALTARGTLHAILQYCVQAMVHHLGAAFARIWLLPSGEDILQLQASAGIYTHLDGAHSRIPIGELKIGLIARERQPHLTNDVLNDPRISDRAWAREQGMVAFAGYPLLVEDQVVGVMAMFAREPLQEDTLDALASVAHAIAQGIGRTWVEDQLEVRVQERTQELALLLEVSRNIASTLELRPLLDTILTQLKTVVDYHTAALHVMQDGQFVLLNHQGVHPLEQGQWRLFLFEQEISRIVHNHWYAPFVVDDIYQDARFCTQLAAPIAQSVPQSLLAMRAWMVVPLITRDQAIGLLTLAHRQPHYYTQRHVNLIQALATQAAIALENARLYGQAQELAALQERQRLARELHDSVAQALYGIALGARTARTLLDRDPARVVEPLDYVLALARAGQAEMRALIFELRPQSLEIEGLVVALTRQVEAVQARYGLHTVLDLGSEPHLPFILKEALYRIAQEALHNTVKHAHATQAEVRLRTLATSIVLEVIDDGVGFEPEHSCPGHFGMQSMRERVAHLEGAIHIVSAPGQGTCIHVTLPVSTPGG